MTIDDKYCCDTFKYMVETDQYHWYDDVCAVLCEDCRRHNGMNHKYCFSCGAKIKRKKDLGKNPRKTKKNLKTKKI